MIGAMFVEVGTEDTVRMSELKIVGYENSAEYVGGLEFSVSCQIRGDNGLPIGMYTYADTSDDGETWNGGKWYDVTVSAKEVTYDDDVFLKAGDGIWFDNPPLADCEHFYLQSNGQVLTGDWGFPMTPGIKQGVCNMMPTATSISKLEIHGYEESATWLGGLEFSLGMQTLGDNGLPLAMYTYSDTSDDGETWNGGKWYDVTISATEITELNDVPVKAGEGFWVDCPPIEDCSAYEFVFPKCLD